MINEHDAGRRAELQAALEAMPRVGLAALPTPFEPCPQLSRALGGPRIWIKRDDLTGLAAGGNKTRMFEFVLGQAMEEGVDTVVGGAAVQSNYCRQLAAACSRLGLQCHLVLRKVRGERDREVQGGLLLDLLVGARVELVEDEGSWESLGARIREKARQLTAAGRKVHVARVGDESGIGLAAVGYVAATLELLDQAEAAEVRIDEIWLCSTDSTQAGIALALKHLRSPIRLVGLPALPEPVTSGWTFEECLSSVANECGALLGLQTTVEPAEITSKVDYVGPGYAVLTEAAREAMLLAGRHEGVLLDPVYTSKAMAGLIDHVRRGLVPAGGNVVFLHTGGLPALFAYADSLDLHEALESG